MRRRVELPALADLGITAVEVMPVAEFDGRFGWGYDGVDFFAPTRLYGTPDDFRHFVDEAHQRGLGVLLDVVYNHFGPSGNYLGQFSGDYVLGRAASPPIGGRRSTSTGRTPNRFASSSSPMPAIGWTNFISMDCGSMPCRPSSTIRRSTSSRRCGRVRGAAAGRGTLVVAEDEFQDTRRLRGGEQHAGRLDAAWNDDFHHAGAWR